jgi:hypothetical protein
VGLREPVDALEVDYLDVHRGGAVRAVEEHVVVGPAVPVDVALHLVGLPLIEGSLEGAKVSPVLHRLPALPHALIVLSGFLKILNEHFIAFVHQDSQWFGEHLFNVNLKQLLNLRVLKDVSVPIYVGDPDGVVLADGLHDGEGVGEVQPAHLVAPHAVAAVGQVLQDQRLLQRSAQPGLARELVARRHLPCSQPCALYCTEWASPC